MEEIMRAGSGVGRQLSVCAVKKLLVSLLILALTGNSAFREMVDEFLRAPVIPVAETGDPVFADSKTEEAVLKMDKTVMADKEKLTLKNQISENEEGWKRLLTEFSVSEPTLRMPHMPEEPGDDLTESAVAEVITEPVIPRIAKADDITAENIPNESMSFENVVPEVDFVLDKKPTRGMINNEISVPSPDFTAAEKSADDLTNMKITVPKPDIHVTGKPAKDAVNMEIAVPKPDVTVTRKLAEDTVNTEITLPMPDTTLTGKPADDTVNTEITAPTPDVTVTEKPADDTVKAEITAPTPDVTVTGKTTDEAVKAELTVTEKQADDTVNTEITVPKPDVTVTEKPTDDPVNTEITVSKPDITVTEKPTDDPVNTEITVPKPDVTVTEKPTDDPVNTEITVPKPDDTVTGKPTDDPVNTEITVPAEDDPSGSDTVVSDDPANGSVLPEPIVPDTKTEDPDVPGDIPSEIVDDNSGAEETISCFLLDEAGMLYGFLPEYAEMPDGCLTLPEECTGIRSGAFAGCGAGILELYIPAGAATIEEGALAGLDDLEWIEADSGNQGCVSDSGVLFDSTMSVLLAFPSAWMDGYAVPPSVTRIAGRAFEGTSISMLDVRECGTLSFGDNVFGTSAGSGIRIVVSEEGLSVYADILAGYAVTLTR